MLQERDYHQRRWKYSEGGKDTMHMTVGFKVVRFKW